MPGKQVQPGERVCQGMRDLVIDLGCGKYKIPNAIGFDIDPNSQADYICDLNQGIPLDDNTVKLVHMSHAFEHFTNFYGIVQEIHRVLQPDGLWFNRIPHATNPMAFYPGHVNFLGQAKWWKGDQLVNSLFDIQEISYEPDPDVWPLVQRFFPNMDLSTAALLFGHAAEAIIVKLTPKGK